MRWTVGILLYLGLALAWVFVFRWKWLPDYHVLVLTVGLVAWIRTLRRPWSYEVEAERLRLIWQQGETAWQWYDIDWRKEAIFDVKHEEWRGLPALVILTKPETEPQPRLLIVYGHEDEEKVRTQVLPLIETYRRQYRQEVWADRLRS